MKACGQTDGELEEEENEEKGPFFFFSVDVNGCGGVKGGLGWR